MKKSYVNNVIDVTCSFVQQHPVSSYSKDEVLELLLTMREKINETLDPEVSGGTYDGPYDYDTGDDR